MNPNNQPAPPAQPPNNVPRPANPPASPPGNPQPMPADIPLRQVPNQPQPVATPPAPATKPVAAPAVALSPVPHPMKTEDLENVLREVNKDVKTEDKTSQNPLKPKSTKPLLTIFVAIIFGLGLCAAAYFAFKSSS